MKCSKCGADLIEGTDTCNLCGTTVSETKKKMEYLQRSNILQKPIKKKTSIVGKIITGVVVLFLIGSGVYSSLDDGSIVKNNEALLDYDSGDNAAAISKLEEAKDDAVSDEAKINTLKNLAYVYATEGDYDKSLATFEEAMDIAKPGTLDYHLIAGEIALLEFDFAAAEKELNAAYKISPNDSQINNSLALFYLDIEDISPDFVDYPKALMHAKKAYENDPDQTEIMKQNLAMAYYFNDQFDDSISLLSATNFAQHPYAAFWLSLAYMGNEDDVNAKKYMDMAVDGGAEVPQEIIDYLNEEVT